MTMNINAANSGNRYLDAFGGTIDKAQKAMDDMLTDANDPSKPDAIQPDNPKFGLTYAGHKFLRDTATNFVSSAQSADMQLAKSVYDRL